MSEIISTNFTNLDLEKIKIYEDNDNNNEAKIRNSMDQDFVLFEKNNIVYKTYNGETVINEIMELMREELSEPYPIFTYRYFLNGWPSLNIMVFDKEKENKFIGCIIGKCEKNKKGKMKGYIGMIAVNKEYRGKKIGKYIVEIFISQCRNLYKADEIELETEVTNIAALNLYGGFGFVKTKILYNYYLNNNNAYKLKLWFTDYNITNHE